MCPRAIPGTYGADSELNIDIALIILSSVTPGQGTSTSAHLDKSVLFIVINNAGLNFAILAKNLVHFDLGDAVVRLEKECVRDAALTYSITPPMNRVRL